MVQQWNQENVNTGKFINIYGNPLKITEKITIEKIETESDLRKCALVLVDAYNNEPWNDEWTEEKAFEKLHCFYNSPKFLGYCIMVDSELVGGCVGNIEPYFSGDYFYLKDMFVKHSFQNKGIGKKLFEHLDKELTIVGIKTQILFTGSETPAYNLYKKYGYEEFESMKMMIKGT